MAGPMTSRMDDQCACTQEVDTAMGRSDSAGTRSDGRLSPRCVIGPRLKVTRTLPPLGMPTVTIVRSVTAVHMRGFCTPAWSAASGRCPGRAGYARNGAAKRRGSRLYSAGFLRGCGSGLGVARSQYGVSGSGTRSRIRRRRLLAGLRHGAVDLRGHARVVEGTREDRHRDRPGLGATADGPAVIAALPGSDSADDQPYDKKHRSDAHSGPAGPPRVQGRGGARRRPPGHSLREALPAP